VNNPNEKQEIIEQALQEAVGGGKNWCGFECRMFSRDICSIDVCGTDEK
jgi:hypothetical protein